MANKEMTAEQTTAEVKRIPLMLQLWRNVLLPHPFLLLTLTEL